MKYAELDKQLDKLVKKYHPVMVIFNDKGNSEKNYLYSKDEFLKRVPGAVFTKQKWSEGSLAANKTYRYTEALTGKQLRNFLTGCCNNFEERESNPDWYWVNSFDDLFGLGNNTLMDEAAVVIVS